MSVGFAIAARHQQAALDKELFQQRTFVLLGDGCMQEDVTLGAASLAGHLKLSNLIWFYDKNGVQIAGKIDRVASDDYAKVYEGMGWEVIELKDGHDHTQLRKALDRAEQVREKPLLIIGRTTMARGAYSMEGSEDTHGAPLPAEERKQTRAKLGLGTDPFETPPAAYSHFRALYDQKRQRVASWKQRFEQRMADGEFKKLFQTYYETSNYQNLPQVQWPRDKDVATRNAFGDVLEKWAEALPHLMGGSADLDGSNMTEQFVDKVGDFSWDKPLQRNVAFGVREFPMSAITNGMALHGGIIPFDATFLSFADYSRPALRLGAIQKVRVIHEFTHDSFFLGEDGPTHQPVEHIMSLRLIPNFYVMRPADAYETQVLMEVALHLHESPSAICLSRQKLPILPVQPDVVAQARFGAYAVVDTETPDVLLIATGGEVSIALEVAKRLDGKRVKVVSMPCWELFDAQPKSYRDKVLNPSCAKRVSIEAGTTLGWQKYTGVEGLNVGLDRFGDSAPAGDLAREYGFTADAITQKVKNHFGF
jgi:transketolase